MKVPPVLKDLYADKPLFITVLVGAGVGLYLIYKHSQTSYNASLSGVTGGTSNASGGPGAGGIDGTGNTYVNEYSNITNPVQNSSSSTLPQPVSNRGSLFATIRSTNNQTAGYDAKYGGVPASTVVGGPTSSFIPVNSVLKILGQPITALDSNVNSGVNRFYPVQGPSGQTLYVSQTDIQKVGRQ